MENITLTLFRLCMLACAGCFTAGIWLAAGAPEALFKTGATFFIVGFANFLLWASLIVYRFLNKLS